MSLNPLKLRLNCLLSSYKGISKLCPLNEIEIHQNEKSTMGWKIMSRLA